jgi:hypothetical protein
MNTLKRECATQVWQAWPREYQPKIGRPFLADVLYVTTVFRERNPRWDGFVCSRARFTAGERHEFRGITLICEAWCKLSMILILSSFLTGLRGEEDRRCRCYERQS